MEHWIILKNNYGHPLLEWWELLVKPGIKKLAIERSKEINKSRRGRLDFLYLLLIHETLKLKKGDMAALEEVKRTQVLKNGLLRRQKKLKSRQVLRMSQTLRKSKSTSMNYTKR